MPSHARRCILWPRLLEPRPNVAPPEYGIFADKLSGKDADRPELAACLDYLRLATPWSCRAWTGCPVPWPT